ncbi:AAA family ATPase [Limosilactobacillus ingluviei]
MSSIKIEKKGLDTDIMLIEFRMTNYASFRQSTVFSAEPGAYLRKYKETNVFNEESLPVLKNLLIFGPNGAGKTRLFKAMNLLGRLVISGGAKTVNSRLPYRPFLFDDSSTNEPTKFGIKFIRHGKIYDYSISYNAKQVLEEKLILIKGNKETIYFERKADIFITLPKPLHSVINRLRPNALLIYFAQQENDPVAREVFEWFYQDLMFLSDQTTSLPEWMAKLLERPELKRELVSFLRFADFIIDDVLVRPVQLRVPEKIANVIQALGQEEDFPTTQLQLFTVHKRYNAAGDVIGTEELPLLQESLGTRQLLTIFLATIYAQVYHNEKTIIIDEFGSSFHHELSTALIRIFNSSANCNQYFVATHDFKLLDEKVRTDQIYLIEKSFKGVSDLKSVFDFKEPNNNGRTDIRFAKRYIEGRYGAVPVIDHEQLTNVLAKTNRSLGVE